MVTLRGPMNTLWNVTSGYVTPTVDLRGRSDGSFISSVQAQVAGLAGVTVETVVPKEISVQLERLETTTVPVHAEVSGTLPPSMTLGTLRVEPETIEVSGPGSLVSQVKEAALIVALDKLGTLVGGNLTIAGDVIAYDASGNVIEGVLLSPRSAVATLPILDAATLKTVPVTPSIFGPPHGWIRCASGSCTPAIVMVTGTSEGLGLIQTISTTAVDSRATQDPHQAGRSILPRASRCQRGQDSVVTSRHSNRLLYLPSRCANRGSGGWSGVEGDPWHNVRIGAHQRDQLGCHGPQVFPDQGLYRCQPASARRWQLFGPGRWADAGGRLSDHHTFFCCCRCAEGAIAETWWLW